MTFDEGSDKENNKKDKSKEPPKFPFGFNPFEHMNEEDRENFNKQFRKIFQQIGQFFSNEADKIDFSSMMEDFFKNMMNPENINTLFKNFGINSEDFQNISKLEPNEIIKQFNNIFKKGKEIKGNRPLIFGMNVKIGPDGIPRFEPFGHIRKNRKEYKSEKYEIDEVREPLSEIIDEDDEIVIVAEMPGCIKEKMKFEASETSITIKGYDEEDKLKFETTIDLPCKVIIDYAKANYKNGILEVRLKKQI